MFNSLFGANSARARQGVRNDYSRLLQWSLKKAPVTVRKGLVLGDLKHCTSGSVFHKMMNAANIQLTADPGDDYCFSIQWSPWSLFELPANLRSRVKTSSIINDTNFKCNKSNVVKCFEQVFGYALSVDPRSHSGPCVVKSEKNASHDGQILECPVNELSSDAVYQLLIDNVIDGNYVEDIRVPIVGNRIPFAYLKYRPLGSRFSNENAYARIAGKYQLFTKDEIRLISLFAREMGLQYGEMDVLRDNPSGRIYIVDVNNTPYGPPNHIEPAEGDLAVRILADSFVEEFVG